MARERWARGFGVVWLAVVAMGAAGCTVGAGVVLRPQSHFSYPNSNVLPLGRVQGEGSLTNFGSATIFDADLEQDIVQRAIAQKGGDLMIDYVLTIQVTTIPLIPIYTTTYRIDGTAAKMTIGKQDLR
jgi:hypothetical protein